MLAEPKTAHDKYINLQVLNESPKSSWAFAFDNDILVPVSRDQDYTYGFNLTLSGASTDQQWASLHRPLDRINDALGLRHRFATGVLGLDIVGDIQESVHGAFDGKFPRGWQNQISDGGELTAHYGIARQELGHRSDDGFCQRLQFYLFNPRAYFRIKIRYRRSQRGLGWFIDLQDYSLGSALTISTLVKFIKN